MHAGRSVGLVVPGHVASGSCDRTIAVVDLVVVGATVDVVGEIVVAVVPVVIAPTRHTRPGALAATLTAARTASAAALRLATVGRQRRRAVVSACVVLGGDLLECGVRPLRGGATGLGVRIVHECIPFSCAHPEGVRRHRGGQREHLAPIAVVADPLVCS